MPPRLPVEPLPAIFLIPQALARHVRRFFSLLVSFCHVFIIKVTRSLYHRPRLPRNDTPGTAKRLVFCSFIKFESL